MLSIISPVTQRTEKLAESIARRIMQDIRRQKLEPGSMLPAESAMLERLGVGRGSLREALRILEINGLVILKPGPKGGPVVAGQNPTAFGQVMTLHLQSLGATYRELLQARVEYEVLLARKAAERKDARPADVARAALVATDDVHDDQRYGAASADFHRSIGFAAGNPVLRMVSDAIYSIWAIRVTRVLYPVEQRDDVLRQHEAIARAIERHEPRRAERLMREHMTAYQEYCEQRYPARMDNYVDWD
jgi:GntR family transcriptional regulator, transcriptional repressor for pyruvate dehydrogenase complex